MDLIDTTWKTIKFNGKELEVYIEVFTEQETESPEGDFDYGNAEENAAELKRFESGELENVCVKVKASFNELEAVDYLGMCFVKADTFKADVLSLVEDHGMIDNVVRDIEAKLKIILDKVS